MRSARRQFVTSSVRLVTLAAIAVAFLAVAPGSAMPSADIVQNPIDDAQLSEPNRNQVYENLTPLIKEKDRRQIETQETPPPEAPETPEKDYGLKDPPSQKQAEEANGGQVPSKGHPMSDGGKICPDGKYAWCGPDIGCLTGCTPNPSYAQAPMDPPADVKDVGNGAMMDRLREAMNGLPITNSQFAVLAGMAPQAGVDQALDPKGWRAAMKQMQQTQTAQGANQQAECAESNTDCAFEMMRDMLINVANEGAATPASPNLPYKTYSQAIWMVQQMYKQCYMPMAILLLLPGAVLTQVKGLVSYMILGSQDEDSISPITGITRAMMAVFLIPATQLIVSYVIDIGNSLTLTVKDHINIAQVTAWAHEQTFNPSCKNNENFIKKIPDTGVPAPFRGKLASVSEKTTIFERQSHMTATLQNVFNTINNMISQGLAILNGFQIILMCYLFLIGPIAAAFFAWPSGVGRDLFKKIFSNWMDGVVVLALWKFWWCIVLLCMSVRLSSGNINVNDQFEMYIYTSFMALLLFVPFQPFDFRPGEIVGKVLEKAAQGGAGGAGGSGGGCGSGNSGGGSSQSGASSDGGSGGQSSADSGSSQGDALAGITSFPGDGDSTSFLRSETNSSASQTTNTMMASASANYANYQTEAISMSQPPPAQTPESNDKSNLSVAMSDVTPPPLAEKWAA